MTVTNYEHLGEALGTDFFSVREQFSEEQWDRFVTTRRFVDDEVLPVIGPYWEQAERPWPLMRRLPELGIVGENIKGYGCSEMSSMACGLVHMELHRGDGSLGTFLGVHAGLAMQSIAMCGSEEQRERWSAGTSPESPRSPEPSPASQAAAFEVCAVTRWRAVRAVPTPTMEETTLTTAAICSVVKVHH